MSKPAAKRPSVPDQVMAAVACAFAALVLFQFYGNATRGYVNTPSLFWWWISQWLDPNAESGHGWLIIVVSGWLLWRNLQRGGAAAPVGTPARESAETTGLGKLEAGNGKPDTDHRRGESIRREAESRFRPAGNAPASALSVAESPAAVMPAHSTPPTGESAIPRSAIAAMIFGLALHAVGFVAQQSRISIVALLVFTWGVVRLAGGRRWGAGAQFPLAFMLFAIPVGMLDEIGLPLRLAVTHAGEGIAHAAGIDLVRSGTQLIAPDGRYHYDVAAPCSGVRSLVALAALSTLIGYVSFGSWARRLLVMATCIPLVYAGNVARIVAIVFAADRGGPTWGDHAHRIMGYGVFAIVLGGVLLAVKLIQRLSPERRRLPASTEWRGEIPGAPVASFELPTTAALGRPAAWLGVALVVLLASGEMLALQKIASAPPRGRAGVELAADGNNPVDLPAFLGTEWIGQRVEVSAIEREILPADTGFSRRNYVAVADRSRNVFLSLVLSGRDRTSIHRPELCLVGQGWTIERSRPHSFRDPRPAAANFPATLLHVRRELPSTRGTKVVPQLVAYWFVNGDTVVPSHWQRFTHDAWNRVVHARADRWAYVLLQTDATDGEAAAIARLQAVLDGTLAKFQRPLAAR